jgi:uncharacterized protein (TIGR02246 family)
MKNRLVVALVGLAISFALPTFAQQTNTPDPQLRQQLDALAKKFDEAYNNNDAAALAALFTEDAVYVTDVGQVKGRQAIEKWDADVFQKSHFSNHHTTVDQKFPHSIGTAGNEVRAIGTWSDTIRDTNGSPRNDEGHYRWVLVREGDTWKIRRDTSSSSNFNAING